MTQAVEMASDGMILVYVPSFRKTGSGILVILHLLPQQFEYSVGITNGKNLRYCNRSGKKWAMD
jgi:hypothetical protein